MTGPSTVGAVRPLAARGRIVVVVLWLLGVVIGAQSGFTLGWFIAYGSAGAFLAIRRPRTSIGWILLAVGYSLALAGWTLDTPPSAFEDGSVPLLEAVVAVVVSSSGVLAFLLLALLAIVFPSGRLPRGRWGTAARIGLWGGTVLMLATLVMPTLRVGPQSVPVRNAIALLPDLALWQFLTPDFTTFIPILLLLVSAALSLVVRARRAGGIERQQLRWFTTALGVLLTAVLTGLAISIVSPDLGTNGVAWIPAIVAVPLMPLAIGIAIMRYRLYEIDRLISRTIGWALVTSVLIAVFTAGLLALQALLEGFTQGQTLAVAASTLVAFALFQPVRRRVQHTVDRRFDRARYDGERTAAAFASRLRDQVDLAELEIDITATVKAALRPSSMEIWIRDHGSVVR